MARATKKNDKVNVFSNNNFSFNFNVSDSAVTRIVFYFVVLVAISKLLAMPFSDSETLIKLLSSFLSALGR